MSTRRKKPEIWIPVIVAIIATVGSIIVARTNIQQAESRARQELLPTISVLETRIAEATSTPILLQLDSTLTIGINTIQGTGDAVIEVPYVIQVPFEVFVKGTASISDDMYVYLIVYDGVAEYVQPDLVRTANNGFEGYCYLGKEVDSGSVNKRYTVFAVVTDQKYGSHSQLDRNTVKAISNTIELYRIR